MDSMTGLTPDQKLVKHYSNKFEACASARKRFEREWYVNLAFYFGRQYVQWQPSVSTSTNSFNLVTPKNSKFRVRHIANRVRPIVRKEVTKLSKEKPQFYAVPASTEDKDVMAARAAEAVGEYILLNEYFNRKRRQATWWACVIGTGFIKTHFDQYQMDSAGYPGRILFDVPSPFHIWVPNLEQPEIEEQPYLFHSVGMSVEDVEDRYGVHIDPDTAASDPESRYRAGLGLSTQEQELSHVFVKETWIKPCKRFPDGAMFAMAQDKLLYMQEALGDIVVDENELASNHIGGADPVSSWPYSHRKYPFTKIDHVPSGKFYSDSVITDLIPLQKDYNRSRSLQIESRNLTAKPQWTVPKGSVDVSKLTSEPGLVIEYLPGFERPQPINNPDLPPYVMESENRTLHDMDFVSNQFEVAQGRTPPGIEAASAIAYLQEENNTILQHTVASIEEAVADVGFKAITLAKDYWEDGRIIQVSSGNLAFEAMLFKQEALPANLDFRVESGSMAPRSKAAKQALITELLKLGVLPPLEALKYLEQSETNRMYYDLQVDERHAQRENYRMMKGEQLPINSFDNHVAHIITHERHMKGQDFERLPDEQKQVFLQHHMEHLVQYGKQTTDAEQTDTDTGEPENNE